MITGPLFLLRVFKGKVRAAPGVGITIWADPSPVVIGNRGLPQTPRITGVRSEVRNLVQNEKLNVRIFDRPYTGYGILPDDAFAAATCACNHNA